MAGTNRGILSEDLTLEIFGELKTVLNNLTLTCPLAAVTHKPAKGHSGPIKHITTDSTNRCYCPNHELKYPGFHIFCFLYLQMSESRFCISSGAASMLICWQRQVEPPA